MSIGKNAFYKCNKITSITIPDNVIKIGEDAFSECPIETATIPAIACEHIKNSALKTVYIISGENIIDDAFRGCDSLISIIIPESVTSIGSYAFFGCSSLTSVYYKGTSLEYDKIIFGDNSTFDNSNIYYYSETEPTESGNYWHYDESGNIKEW